MKLKKFDIILIFSVCIVAIVGFAAYKVLGEQQSGVVRIEVDGNIYGEYPLSADQKIAIQETNLLIIENGEANMLEADCPDQICVRQRAISKNGETIVCLPNKVIVRIVSEEKSELDAIAN